MCPMCSGHWHPHHSDAYFANCKLQFNCQFKSIILSERKIKLATVRWLLKFGSSFAGTPKFFCLNKVDFRKFDFRPSGRLQGASRSELAGRSDEFRLIQNRKFYYSIVPCRSIELARRLSLIQTVLSNNPQNISRSLLNCVFLHCFSLGKNQVFEI